MRAIKKVLAAIILAPFMPVLLFVAVIFGIIRVMEWATEELIGYGRNI